MPKLTETVSVPIQRWPTPEEGGGVFTTPAQMAECLVAVHDLLSIRGTLTVGDGVKLVDKYVLEFGEANNPAVVAEKDTHLIAYYLGVLKALTADEYATATGNQP